MTGGILPTKLVIIVVLCAGVFVLLLHVNHPLTSRLTNAGVTRRDAAVVSEEPGPVGASSGRAAAVQVMEMESDPEVPKEANRRLPVMSPGQKKLNYLRSHSVSDTLIGLDLEAMDETTQVLTINSYLDNVDTICRRKFRLGHLADGGWELCDDEEVRPVPPCIVYSFGINKDWTFDEDISTLYGCHVYAFDPSIEEETHNRTDHIHFYKWGLSGKEEVSKIGWQLYSFEDIRRKLGHTTKTIDVVKMDIERAEWGSLPNMIETGQLDDVKQFLVEYHVRADNKLQQLRIYQKLEEMGFGKFDVHKNIHCPCTVPGFPVKRTGCYEVHYRRVKGR